MSDHYIPFKITIPIEGVSTELEVLPEEDYYKIFRDGELFTEVLPNEIWYQYSGLCLGDNLIASIGEAIEKHYE